MGARFQPQQQIGVGSVTISDIRSTAPSLCAVADSCTIHLDRRLTTGETEDSVVAQIRALPAVAMDGATVTVLEYAVPSYTGLVYPTKKYFPSWRMELTDPAIEAAVRGYRRAFASQPDLGFWTFSTNGVATAGLNGIPTVGFGPGEDVMVTPKRARSWKRRIRAKGMHLRQCTAREGIRMAGCPP